jgi:uncharacterized lipoprotein YehR (DUF1307 family)
MSVKKCWYILFALIMLLSLVSCNQNNEHQIVLKRPTGYHVVLQHMTMGLLLSGIKFLMLRDTSF